MRIDENDPRVAAGHARLDAYRSAIGPCDVDLISDLVNPMFQGKPAWPNTRQADRIVRPAGSLVIASDGLSDPFVGTEFPEQGFGCEVYIAAPQLAGADFESLKASWAFSVVENFAMTVAKWGGLQPSLQRHGVVSTEFPMRGVLPDHMVASDGAAGFLINLTPPGRSLRIEDMPLAPIDIVALTPLPPCDLERLRSAGAAARGELAAGRCGPDGHVSRI